MCAGLAVLQLQKTYGIAGTTEFSPLRTCGIGKTEKGFPYPKSER